MSHCIHIHTALIPAMVWTIWYKLHKNSWKTMSAGEKPIYLHLNDFPCPVLSAPWWYHTFFPYAAFPSFSCLLIAWVTNRNVLIQIRWQTSLIRTTDNVRGWGHSWDWFLGIHEIEVCTCFLCVKMEPFFGISLVNMLTDFLWVLCLCVCVCACPADRREVELLPYC